MGVITVIKPKEENTLWDKFKPVLPRTLVWRERTGGEGLTQLCLQISLCITLLHAKVLISFGAVIQKKIQKRETALKPQTHQQPSQYRVYLVITLFRRKLEKRLGNRNNTAWVLLPKAPELYRAHQHLHSQWLVEKPLGVWGCSVMGSTVSNQVWWYQLVILALWRWTEVQKFKAILSYLTEFKARLGYTRP